MIITFAGKGGVGKTTVASIVIDELARHDYEHKVLLIDADPAATLAMTLGVEVPASTLADVHNSTPLDTRQIRRLSPGTSPAQFVVNRLESAGAIARRRLREMAFDLLLMGYDDRAGGYCRLNQALTKVLASIQAEYDLIIIDNEAGFEHISRYRLTQVDLFILVLTPGRASWQVANRIRYTADEVGISIGQTWFIYNRVYQNSRLGTPGPRTLLVPECPTMMIFDRQGGPIPALAENHSFRQAVAPIIKTIFTRTTSSSQFIRIPFNEARPSATTGDSLPEIEAEVEPFRRPDTEI